MISLEKNGLPGLQEIFRTIGVFGLLGGMVVWAGILFLWWLGTLAFRSGLMGPII